MKIQGLAEINIGGKMRPMKFGTNATAILCEKRGCMLKDIIGMFSPEKINNQEITGGEIRDLIWSGLVAGAKSKNIDVDFNEFNVGDWIDQLDADELKKAFDVILESSPVEKKKTGKAKAP